MECSLSNHWGCQDWVFVIKHLVTVHASRLQFYSGKDLNVTIRLQKQIRHDEWKDVTLSCSLVRRDSKNEARHDYDTVHLYQTCSGGPLSDASSIMHSTSAWSHVSCIEWKPTDELVFAHAKGSGTWEHLKPLPIQQKPYNRSHSLPSPVVAFAYPELHRFLILPNEWQEFVNSISFEVLISDIIWFDND